MNKDVQLIAEAYNNVSKTENIDVDQLIDAIKQQQIAKGNKEYAYSYAVGVLSSLIKSALHSPKTLQDEINRSYRYYTTGE